MIGREQQLEWNCNQVQYCIGGQSNDRGKYKKSEPEDEKNSVDEASAMVIRMFTLYWFIPCRTKHDSIPRHDSVFLQVSHDNNNSHHTTMQLLPVTLFDNEELVSNHHAYLCDSSMSLTFLVFLFSLLLRFPTDRQGNALIPEQDVPEENRTRSTSIDYS
jgi:hypothetical protein